jgi:hypothetical protein
MSDVKHDTSVKMSDLGAALRPLFNESLELTVANDTTKVNIKLELLMADQKYSIN